MPVIQREISVAANSTNDNALSGSAFEFLRRNAVISAGVTAAATGIVFNINSGADVVVEESDAVIATRFPIIPDEMYYNDVGVQGDRLVIRLRNTTGGALVVRVLVQITEI